MWLMEGGEGKGLTKVTAMCDIKAFGLKASVSWRVCLQQSMHLHHVYCCFPISIHLQVESILQEGPGGGP